MKEKGDEVIERKLIKKIIDRKEKRTRMKRGRKGEKYVCVHE